MVALKGKDIGGFLKKRPAACFLVLIYGGDGGMVRERSDIVARQIVDDLHDPFNTVELTNADLKEHPGRLADEAAALSFMGGQRLIRYRGSDDAISKAVKALLAIVDAGSFEPNALIIIEAGNLRKTAGLRKTIEAHKRTAALPCYEQSAAENGSYIQETLATEGLTIEPEALALWMDALPPDRGILQSELEKLCLYMGPQENRSADDQTAIGLADVKACLADRANDDSFAIGDLIFSGQTKNLARAMQAAKSSGASSLGWLRLVQLTTLKLYSTRKLMEGGMPADGAMRRQGVMFPASKAFQHHLQKWSAPRLEQALTMLADVELEAKTTGAPVDELIERTALRLSVMAQR